METLLIALILGFFGLTFGSFVNAAVWRLHERRDIVHERSECVHCHHTLAWYDLIPVFSWLQLRGKCRYCKKAIAWQYPAVELAVSAYFVISYLFWSASDLTTTLGQIDFGLWLVYGVMLAILFVYDLRWYLLPDRIVFPLIGLAALDAVLRLVAGGDYGFGAIINELVLPLVPIAGLYWLLYIVSRGSWIGFGDVKLGIFLGLALGWQGALVCLFTANLLGFLIVVPGLLSKRIGRSTRIPFGPLLIAGFVIAGLFAQAIIAWYLGPLSQSLIF